MKRSDLQQILKDRIEMRIRENHYASDNTDYERWAFAHFLADELISLIEEQGMQPPPYTFKQKVVNNPTGDTISVIDYDWEDEE